MKKLSQFNSNFMDICRIVAAWLVLIGHASGNLSISFFKNQDYFPYIQNIGVVILFLLSGFFTVYSMENKIFYNAEYSFKDFFAERFTRIGVAYIPALFFTAIVDKIRIIMYPESYLYYEAFNVKTFIANLFMLQDYKRILDEDSFFTSFGSNRPLWTLAIEWWIYMTVGYFILVIIRKKTVNIWQIILFLFLAWIPINNLIGGRGNGIFFVWLLGAGICYIYKRIEATRKLMGVLGIATVIIGLIYAFVGKEAYHPFFVMTIAFVIMSVLVIGRDVKKVYFTKIIKFFTSYTYSLYLIHYVIADFIALDEVNIGRHSKLFLTIIISNIIAIIFSLLFEKNKLLISKMKNTLKKII